MIHEFYTSVFPALGVRVLAVFKNGLKKAPEHYYFDTTADLLEAAATYDALGKNVYHACSVYKTADNRTGDNTLCQKSLWLDLDVGPKKPYATQKEAALHFEEFRTALGLPKSHVVSSGGGIHEYLPFTKPITPVQWDKLSALFAQCLDHYGVKHDTSRTRDKASILRIPGTHNYKAQVRPVTLKRLGEEVAAADLWKLLKTYAEANDLLVAAAKPAKATNKLIAAKDYQPSSGELVAQHCAAIGEVEASGGDVGYELWWRAMGVAKHCVDPDAVAAHWTREREATGHDKFGAQEILDGWSVGPTTCEEFAKHSSKCATCVHNGKTKSPIQLGVAEIPLVVPLAQQIMPPKVLPAWTFNAPWITTKLATELFIGFSNGGMTMQITDENGQHKHVPFCDRYWQVMKRVRTMEGIWKLEIAYEQYPGKPPKTFLLDSAAVTAPDVLRKEFSARELHIYGGPKAMYKSQEMIRFEQDIQYQTQTEVVTYPTMGWCSEDNHVTGDITGEFVLGDMLYRAKQKPQRILLDDTADRNIQEAFSVKGTALEWSALVDFIYNRPGAEAYQFLIASMFAAPLVRLMPGEGEWHGIPVVVDGDSGSAKTSTCLVAASIYTRGSALKFSAEDKQGDTINALSIKMGSLRNIPFILDELTNAPAEKISSLMYMTATGKNKDRMGQNGKMIPNPYRWDVLSLITSNESLHEVLKKIRSQNVQEASQMRCFQITVKRADLNTVFHDVNRTTVEDELLGEQYGMVGREWIQFLVDNRVALMKKLQAERASYQIGAKDQPNIRFYKDLILTVKVAATMAKAKGFIHWNIANMIRWAEGQLMVLRDSIDFKDWDGLISDFVASLHGRTIVTHTMKIGPGKRSAQKEAPIDQLSTAAIPVARKAIDDKRFVVTANALKDWAYHNRIMPSTLLSEMMQRGYLHGIVGQKIEPKLINIGSGTTITRPQAPCYELDYYRIANYSASDAEGSDDLGNVVSINPQVVTNLVTKPDSDSPDVAASP